jgi:hypothetical protein
VSARGPGQAPESVIVWAGVNRVMAGICGFLILLWGGILLGIEIHGPPTVGDRIAAAVIFGFLILLSVDGQTVEAAQLLELFGPFPATATEGEPHIALTAAVFEDVGDKLIRRNRDNARDAYRRAAIAQRAFADCARSPDQAAARLAEASRIEGKAEA